MASKILPVINLAELLKRVPPNQLKQFDAFVLKTQEYKKRVNKFPEKLPKIDWDYYRQNVRDDFKQMVEQFQIKYEELSHVFDSRHEVLDHRKYFTELEELTAQVKDEIKQFKEESNDRIRIYENELRRLKNLVPYENMTIEQFVIEREDLAQYIPGQGKPLFWPHDPAEQCIGPARECQDSSMQTEDDEKSEEKPIKKKV